MVEATDAKIALLNKAHTLNEKANDDVQFINTAVIAEKLPVGILVCSLNASKSVEIHYLNAFARK
jgi:hypothetical protein